MAELVPAIGRAPDIKPLSVGITRLCQPRGKLAGYQYPEASIRRGRPHLMLYETALERLGR